MCASVRLSACVGVCAYKNCTRSLLFLHGSVCGLYIWLLGYAYLLTADACISCPHLGLLSVFALLNIDHIFTFKAVHPCTKKSYFTHYMHSKFYRRLALLFILVNPPEVSSSTSVIAVSLSYLLSM